jgi:hypothetical protein
VISLTPATVSPALADAARSCETLARARRLAEWVGPGRTLTASQVLRPADATRACQDLGVETRRARLRSALDSDELMRDWTIALAAGFLDTDGRRAWAAGPSLHGPGTLDEHEPGAVLSTWLNTVAATLEVGEDPCPGCLAVLHELHTSSQPVKLARLAEVLTEALYPGEVEEEDEEEPCSACGEVHGPGYELDSGDFSGDDDFLDEDDDLDDDFLGELDEDDEIAGHVGEALAELLAFGAATISDGEIQLTPLGSMLAASVFQGHALAPDADAQALVAAVSEMWEPVAQTLARPWLSARSAADAVGELLSYAESASGVARLAALAFAREVGPEAMSTWRDWAGRPGFGAYARRWLKSEGEPVDEDPADDAWLIVDELNAMLEATADTMAPFMLHEILPPEAREEIAEGAPALLASGHPSAADVVAKLTGPAALTAPRRRLPAGDGHGLVYQLKITLRGVSKPPVWRRVLVGADITLRDLHDVVQRAMGWEDDHLHVFSTGHQDYGSQAAGAGFASDKKAQLSKVLTHPKQSLRYTYDFGDDWEHDIVLEEIQTSAPGQTYPTCLAGRGACPPEDCGGVWGYANLKEAVADAAHEDHEDMREWLGLNNGADFDPAAFSAEDANARLG